MVFGIDPNQRQFHFPCWISKTIPGVSFLEPRNKIVSEMIPPIAQKDRGSKHGRQKIQQDRDQSQPTPVSFSMLD